MRSDWSGWVRLANVLATLSIVGAIATFLFAPGWTVLAFFAVFLALGGRALLGVLTVLTARRAPVNRANAYQGDGASGGSVLELVGKVFSAVTSGKLPEGHPITKRLSALRMLAVMDYREENQRGTFRGRGYGVIDYTVVPPAGMEDAHEELSHRTLHILFVECDLEMPPLHLVNVQNREMVNAELPPALTMELHSFNQEWRAHSRDARTAHAFLTPAIIASLMTETLRIGTVFVESGLIAYVTVQPLKPTDERAILDSLCDIVELIPEHLRLEFPSQEHPPL